MLRMTQVCPTRELQQSPIAGGLRAVAWLVGLAMSGCATPPPAISPARVAATVPEPTCPSCDEQNREIARLRQELAGREVELRDLRTNQREQVPGWRRKAGWDWRKPDADPDCERYCAPQE